jgi:hypothetical protein
MNPPIHYVSDTRRFGHTYIHASIRRDYAAGIPCTLDGVPCLLTWAGYGRSLLSKRGHKYKAYLNYSDSGKPVPTKQLSRVALA